jgi:hypothetical protein
MKMAHPKIKEPTCLSLILSILLVFLLMVFAGLVVLSGGA